MCKFFRSQVDNERVPPPTAMFSDTVFATQEFCHSFPSLYSYYEVRVRYCARASYLWRKCLDSFSVMFRHVGAIFVCGPCRSVVGIAPKTNPELFGPFVGLLPAECLLDHNVAVFHEEVNLVGYSNVNFSEINGNGFHTRVRCL